MKLWNVAIRLELLRTEITWTISESGLPGLRAAISAGELGRAHIVRLQAMSPPAVAA